MISNDKLANWRYYSSLIFQFEWMASLFVCALQSDTGYLDALRLIYGNFLSLFIYYFCLFSFYSMRRHDPISAITYILLTLAKRYLNDFLVLFCLIIIGVNCERSQSVQIIRLHWNSINCINLQCSLLCTYSVHCSQFATKRKPEDCLWRMNG